MNTRADNNSMQNQNQNGEQNPAKPPQIQDRPTTEAGPSNWNAQSNSDESLEQSILESINSLHNADVESDHRPPIIREVKVQNGKITFIKAAVPSPHTPRPDKVVRFDSVAIGYKAMNEIIRETSISPRVAEDLKEAGFLLPDETIKTLIDAGK